MKGDYEVPAIAASRFKATSKNVIPVKTGIYNQLELLDSRFRESDRLGIIRGSLKIDYTL